LQDVPDFRIDALIAFLTDSEIGHHADQGGTHGTNDCGSTAATGCGGLAGEFIQEYLNRLVFDHNFPRLLFCI
jgi:hypothetical protein